MNVTFEHREGVNFSDRSDEDLLDSARAGSSPAYGELWRRHAAVGTALARKFSGPDLADDLVAEAFLRILSTIQRGGGPVSGFRAYLTTTIRNVAKRWAEKPTTLELELASELEDPSTVDDPAIAALDRALTLAAFRTLPERWQTVLWYGEVEGMSPQEIAPFLGMTPNATAALAYRARVGLREAWLQAHLKTDSIAPECRWSTARLSAYVADKLTPRERKTVADHLASCTKCAIIAGELEHFGSHLAFVLFPLVAGSVAAPALIAALSHGSSLAGQASAATMAAQANLASLSARPAPHALLGGHVGWIAAATATVLVAGTAGVLVLTAAHGPATKTAAVPAASATSSPATTQPPTDPTSTPAPRPTAPATVAPILPVIRVVHRPKPSPPPIPVTAPVTLSSSNAFLTNRPSPILSGTGVPGAMVTLSQGGSILQTSTVDTLGNWSLSTPLTDGVHALAVTERSGANGASVPVLVTATVDTVAPAAPAVTSPIDYTGAVAPFAVAGTGRPGETISLEDSFGRHLASVTVDSVGNWNSGLLTTFDAACFGIAVFEQDAAGNLSNGTALEWFDLAPSIAATSVGGGSASISLRGWPGQHERLTLSGAVLGSGGKFDGVIGADGLLTMTFTGLVPDTYTASISYLGPDGTIGYGNSSTSFTIS